MHWQSNVACVKVPCLVINEEAVIDLPVLDGSISSDQVIFADGAHIFTFLVKMMKRMRVVFKEEVK